MNASAAAVGLIPAAESLLKAGRRDEARRTFRRALELQPDDARAACGLVRLLVSERDMRGAVEVVQAAMVRTPLDLRLAALQRGIGLALFGERLWADAEPWLERAVALEPWDPALVRPISGSDVSPIGRRRFATLRLARC
jgi:tetratricopeptide (TPR) repeat protein